MKSIRWKILIYTGAVFLLVMAVVIGDSSAALYRNLIENSRKMMARAVKEAALQIEQSNLEAVTAARIMAYSQEAGLFGQRQESILYARRVLEEYPQFTGTYFGYEPDADGRDREFSSRGGTEHPGHDVAGRFLPYWFREGQEIRLNPLIDMESSLYYQGVRDQFLSGTPILYMITEPYVYEGKMIVEQTYPVIRNGQFVGIAGVDRSLTFINRYLSGLKPYQSADFILISRLGGIIAATHDPALETEKIEATAYAGVLNPIYEKRGNADILSQEDARDRLKYFYASAPIETGQWILVMRAAEDEILAPARQSLYRLILMSLLGLGATLLVLYWIANSITRPVNRAVETADRIASGDLTGQVETTGKDEVGRLLRAIGTMRSRLGDLLGHVQASVTRVITAVSQLGATSREMEATMAQQVASTNQVVASATEISASSRELLKTMDEVAGVSAETAQAAGSGQESLNRMQEAIRQMQAAADSVAARLSDVHKQAAGVTQVVTTITRISDQTNLLSLNASIEAEKAGQYGAGFTVVAREIRRLADQTSVATLDIEQIVKGMQSALTGGLEEMRRFGDQVRQAVDGVNRADEELRRIIRQVQELSPRFEAVNSGMELQSTSAVQIREAMIQLSDVSRQTESALRDAGNAINDLGDAARGLQGEVARFRLES